MEEKKAMFTVKNVLRVLLLFCIIFVFCPSFLVSCSGQNVNVSVMTAVSGVKVYGEYVANPKPIMLVCLVLPVVALVILFIKKFMDKKTAAVVLGCAAVDTVVWFIFRSVVKKYAEENFCIFKTTVWYVLNIIALLLMCLLTALVIANKMKLDTNLIAILSGGSAQSVLNQMSEKMDQVSSAVTKLASDVKDESARRVAEEKARIETEAEAQKLKESKKASQNVEPVETQNTGETLFCYKCGTELESDSVFCTSCGSKVR